MQYGPIYDPETNSTIYRLHRLGDVTGELVIPNAEDDGYSIYLDEGLTDEQAIEKAHHALEHIKYNHFEKADVQQIEAEAHHMAQPAEEASPEDPKKQKHKRTPVTRERPAKAEDFYKAGLHPPKDYRSYKVIDRPPMSKKEFMRIREEMEWARRKRSFWGK